jgi:hypothetical protein
MTRSTVYPFPMKCGILTLSTLGLLLISSNLMAKEKPALMTPRAPISPLFSLIQAQASFESGQPVNEAELQGVWRLYGVVQPSSAPSLGDPNGYSASGLENKDASDRTKLVIAGGEVTIEGLGFASMNQGPNPLTMSPTGSVSFDQYAYQSANFGDASTADQTYFVTVCKSTQSQTIPGAVLICQLTLEMGENAIANAGPDDVKATGTVVSYHGYMKAN